MKKCLVLVNPASGDGKSMESIPKLEKRLEESFDQVEIIETREEGQGAKLAQKACREKVHSLFVIGGDGTFHEIINGLAEEDHRPILGLLPGGTNNTYYRLIGENRDLDAAIDAIDLKTTTEVDLGQCNDRFFIYYTCFGRLIDATTSTDGEEKEKLGPLAYVKNIFKALPEDETYQIKLVSDGGNYQGPASHVYVFLVDQVGNLNFSEMTSSLSSGKLYVFILTNAKTASKLTALKDMVMGQLDKNEDIQAMACSKLSIEELKGEPVDLDMDGEMEAKLPAQIRILPKHIRVYLPKEKE